MRLQYILDDAGNPVPCDDLLTWARWFETANRHVDQTHVEEAWISTVFLGIDHNFSSGGPPILFETLVFLPDREFGIMERYATRAEAQAGHDLVVRAVQSEYQLAHYLTIDALGGIVAGLRAGKQAPAIAAVAPAAIHYQPRLGATAARRRRRQLNYARRPLKEIHP